MWSTVSRAPGTLGRLGLNFDQPRPLPTNLPFFYCASGTWATPFQGPPFDVGRRVEQTGRIRYPFLRYNESIAYGVAELMRLILMNAGQFYLCGYSQGAEVIVRTLRLMLPGQPLAHRAGDLLKVITFGSPCRPPGPTLLGNNPSGISRIDTPEQFRSRTYDFVLDGDIYATATGDTLLHLGDETLTPLELDLPFALKIFTLIQEQRVPLATKPRQHTRELREIGENRDRRRRLSDPQPANPLQRLACLNGVTGVDRAVQIVATGSTGGL